MYLLKVALDPDGSVVDKQRAQQRKSFTALPRVKSRPPFVLGALFYRVGVQQRGL